MNSDEERESELGTGDEEGSFSDRGSTDDDFPKPRVTVVETESDDEPAAEEKTERLQQEPHDTASSARAQEAVTPPPLAEDDDGSAVVGSDARDRKARRRRRHPEEAAGKVTVVVQDDGTTTHHDQSETPMGKFCVAPLLSSFSEVQRQTKDNEDKPMLRDDIRIPSRFAVKSMRVLGVVELICDIHPSLKDKEFELSKQAFHLRCGDPEEVLWSISGLLEEAGRNEGWSIERVAEFIAERYVTPQEFFEMIKPSGFDLYKLDLKKLDVRSIVATGDGLFTHNFTDVYRSYLNRGIYDDILHLIDRHKRMLEDRRSLLETFDRLCRSGNMLVRVNRRDKFASMRGVDIVPLMLRDIPHLPEMQMALVCEKNSDFIYLNEPLPQYISKHGEGIWDIALANLRRLYLQKTWIKRRCIPIRPGEPAEDGIWLYFLEGYDCECLAFIGSTMFFQDRMREVSRLKVKGDLIMCLVRDDVTMFCGAEEPWSIAYMSHVGVDSAGHEAYVGKTFRLDAREDGTFAWIMYKPRTAKEAVIPQNRVEVDLYVCQLQQDVHPTGCANCHRLVSKLMICSRCHNNFYCTKDCQQAHWTEHKAYCVKKRGGSKGASTLAERQSKSYRADRNTRLGKSARENPEYVEMLRQNLPKKYHKYVKALLQ